ncbi:hypothetical protein NLG97_g6114 [Lecanicillium saksenae]|uniref:Uncharacterized protein n=1 Tax=Lecanicillium saksenae TaxID=468837 RepID=A0ACC1QS67_9HYPO|nr:hypothetical protein NLG97_g6114 [Lecanicillium saksenae]
MLSRSLQLRRIVAARPLALAPWRGAGNRAFGATALLAKRRDIPSTKLYTSEQMFEMVTGSSPTASNILKPDSDLRTEEQEHAPTPDKNQNVHQSRVAREPDSTKLTIAEHAEMPDIENYEPTEAELDEMLAAHTTPGEEGLSTADAEAADMAARLAHNEYDTLASEDDLLFESSPGESLPKSRPFNHELLTHQHVGVSALGRPVEALILKDPNRMKRSRKQIPVFEPEVTEAKPSVELKWTDYVPKPEDQQDPVLQAWDNIDEMRPTENKILPAHEYHKLVAELVDGFTHGQLSSYITMKHAQELEAEADDKSQRYPWIQKQTPWNAAYQIELESRKPKYVCSAAIIDKIWKLEVREQVESLGRALLWVEPVTFRLLTGHGRPVLEAIQREMLNPVNNERLAAKSEESRIGIYASKAAIPPIIERLNGIAQAVTSAPLSTEYIKKENLTQPVLDNLASITNTIIEKTSDGKELTVHWIADADRPKPLNENAEGDITPERPVDIVWRLLMAAQASPGARTELSSKILTHKGRGNKAKEAVYMDYHREERSKSWRDKLRSWTRYIGPVTKAEETKLQALQLASRVELVELASPVSDAARVSNITIATFGHILHLSDVTKTSSKNADKSRRILSPVIPHPAALTTLSASDGPVTQSTAIILNFYPDATEQPQEGTTLPRVRLTLPVDETTDLSNFDIPPSSTLHAVVTQRVQDLLLPSESVDVRLAQQQLLALDAAQPALKQFLASSEFNLLEGRLRTPSRIALTLPDAGSDLPYLFTGLEVHQAVEMRLEGHALRYESIEAGQHGGQRQELSLHRMGGGEKSGGDDGFLGLVEAVAAGEVFSWNDGAALMQQRSSETFSMDMLEDQEAVDEEQHEEDEAEEGGLVNEPEQNEVVVREDVVKATADEETTSPRQISSEEPFAGVDSANEAATDAAADQVSAEEPPEAAREVDAGEAVAAEQEAAANGDDASTASTGDASEKKL